MTEISLRLISRGSNICRHFDYILKLICFVLSKMADKVERRGFLFIARDFEGEAEENATNQRVDLRLKYL